MIWYFRWIDIPESIRALPISPHVGFEAHTDPSGHVWYRVRSEQEAKDLERIQREHHPDFAADAGVKGVGSTNEGGEVS